MSGADLWAPVWGTCSTVAAEALRGADKRAGLDPGDIAADAVVRLLEGGADPATLTAAAIGRAVRAEVEQHRRAARKVAPVGDAVAVLVDGGDQGGGDQGGEVAAGTLTATGDAATFWGWDGDARQLHGPDVAGGYGADAASVARILGEGATARRLVTRPRRQDVAGVAESSRWAMRPASDVRDHLRSTWGLRARTDSATCPALTGEGSEGAAALWADLLDGGAAALGLDAGTGDAGTVLVSAMREVERYDRAVYVPADAPGARDRFGRRVVLHHRGDVRVAAGLVWDTLYEYAETASGERLTKRQRATLRRLVGLWGREVGEGLRCSAPVVLDPSTESAAALAATAGAAYAAGLLAFARADGGAAVVGGLLALVGSGGGLDVAAAPSAPTGAHRAGLLRCGEALTRQAVGLLSEAEHAAALVGVVLDQGDDGDQGGGLVPCGCVRCGEVVGVRAAGKRERWNLGKRTAVLRAVRLGAIGGPTPFGWAAAAGYRSAGRRRRAAAWAALRLRSTRGRHGITARALVPGSWQWGEALRCWHGIPAGTVATLTAGLRLRSAALFALDQRAATVAGRATHALGRSALGSGWSLGAVWASDRPSLRALGKLRRCEVGSTADVLASDGEWCAAVGGGSVGLVLVGPAADVPHREPEAAGLGCGCRVCWAGRVRGARQSWGTLGVAADRLALDRAPGGLLRGGQLDGERLAFALLLALRDSFGGGRGWAPGWAPTPRTVRLSAVPGTAAVRSAAAVGRAVRAPARLAPVPADTGARAAALLDAIGRAGAPT